MFAKLKEQGTINDLLLAEDHTNTWASSISYWDTCCSYTISYSWTINIRYVATLWRWTSQVSASGLWKIQVNGVDVDSFTLSAGWEWIRSKQVETTRTISVSAWDTVTLFVKKDDWSSRPSITYNESYVYQTANFTITPDMTFVPTEIKEIWHQTGPVLFWLTPEWVFYVWKEVSSATTGSISPGNFVGYLQIWNYKIPYYT